MIYSCKSEVKKEEPAAENTAEEVAQNTVLLSDAQFKNASIETGIIESRVISFVIKVNGKIDVPPQNLVSISVPSGGYLKKSELLEGMHIIKGQVLAVIEDQQFIQMQEDYLLSKSKIIFAKAEYERQKELNISKASSDKVFQQARAEYNALQILVQTHAEKLKFIGINPASVSTNHIVKNISIYAPISGFVSKVNVNVGKYANPSEVLFEIVDPTDIHLALHIFEKDFDKLYIGQKLYAYSNTNPNKKYLCEIILVGKNISEDKSAEVHCHFMQYDKTLIPGMYMNANIELENSAVDALPSDAIVNFENQHFVFVDQGNKKYEMVPVDIGTTENNYTTILSSKNLIGKQIVTKGAYTLLMKNKNVDEE
jgi:cobalt-zinc-cadmium efflux system membrane fusion protein